MNGALRQRYINEMILQTITCILSLRFCKATIYNKLMHAINEYRMNVELKIQHAI